MIPREQLAACVHESWAGWMKYLFAKSRKNPDGTVTIPAWAVERWTRQLSTPYADLPESEKETDRAEAVGILEAMGLPTGDPETCKHENMNTYDGPQGNEWSRCNDCGKIFE